MKKITLGFSVLALGALFFTGCKKTAPVAPPADTELQSSIDATFALYSITDVEMIAAYIADVSLFPKFYMPTATSPGSVTPNNDTLGSSIKFSFNQTDCLDGKHRDGSVFVDRDIAAPGVWTPYANPNARYYSSYGYAERISLSEYKVDGWKIVTTHDDGTEGYPAFLYNNVSPSGWNPATTNLSWKIKGSFKLLKDQDSMLCTLDITKTLLNTNDPLVFPPAKNKAVNWALANVSYSGRVTGYTTHGVPFVMQIGTDNPIIRKFSCSPTIVTSVAPTSTAGIVTQKTSEYHPFVDGIALFNTAQLYQREILYGGSETSGSGQCDNSGAVVIKGIYYAIDFRLK